MLHLWHRHKCYFFLCGSVGGMVLIIKSKAKIISSKIPEPLCIHLSFHGFLKHCLLALWGISAPTVFHHIYRSSHI